MKLETESVHEKDLRELYWFQKARMSYIKIELRNIQRYQWEHLSLHKDSEL